MLVSLPEKADEIEMLRMLGVAAVTSRGACLARSITAYRWGRAPCILLIVGRSAKGITLGHHGAANQNAPNAPNVIATEVTAMYDFFILVRFDKKSTRPALPQDKKIKVPCAIRSNH